MRLARFPYDSPRYYGGAKVRSVSHAGRFPFLYAARLPCAVLVMLDHETRRVYRLFDFTKRLRLTPDIAYCVAGKVNSVNTLYLVVESVKAGHQVWSAFHSSCSS